MPFSRYLPFGGRTLAWRLFKRHHTHFNDIFWAQKTTKIYAYSCTRPYQRTDPSTVLFPFVSADRRLPATLGVWADTYDAFDRWTRMASVIAIAGYLETFIAQIGTATLESCPSLVFGGGVRIDGAVLLKNNPKYDLYSYAEPLVKGHWQSRMSAYKRFFGSCPFESALSDLERLRKLRNDAGHSFGRDIESMKFPSTFIVERLPLISDRRIQQFLNVVEIVAASIEKHLRDEVGQYEIIKVYHKWPLRASSTKMPQTAFIKSFSGHVTTLTLDLYGRNAARDLVSYYDSL